MAVGEDDSDGGNDNGYDGNGGVMTMTMAAAAAAARWRHLEGVCALVLRVDDGEEPAREEA